MLAECVSITYCACMKTIQIRDVPDGVHASLRSRAALVGLSLSEFMLREAERIARRPELADSIRYAQDRSWGVAAGTGVSVLRSLRDER